MRSEREEKNNAKRRLPKPASAPACTPLGRVFTLLALSDEDASVLELLNVDVIGWVTVERLLETLLIQVVPDESDGAAKDEQSVESTDLRNIGEEISGRKALESM